MGFRSEVTKLMIFIRIGEVALVRSLVAQREELVRCEDYDLRTPLHIAIQQGNTEIVQLLLDKGAKVNAKDRWDRTPLDMALLKGDEKLIELLDGSISK